MSLDQLKAEIETDLYSALEALEAGDIITVRQCAARTQTNAVDLWRRTNAAKDEHESAAA